MKTTARQWCSNLSTENKTPEPTMDRMALLNEILSQNPADPFARYGLAMEYSNAGDVERALDEFKKLLATNPDYTAGYFMAAQTLTRAGRTDAAKKMLDDGKYRQIGRIRLPTPQGRSTGDLLASCTDIYSVTKRKQFACMFSRCCSQRNARARTGYRHSYTR